LSLGKRVVDYLTKEYKPDLVLLVDYGAFNLNISKFLKRASIKTFYYIPPQVWASRKWRLNTMKKTIDQVLGIFPFERAFYEDANIPFRYCGHPIVGQLPPPADKTEFFARHGLDPNKKLVSIFPGSRTFELKHLMELFTKSARELQKKHPDLQFCVSQAPNLSDKVFPQSEFKVIKCENHALLSVSDSLILASGTVALEAALYQTPMLIAYRGPFLFYLIYLMLVCTKYVSLPNVITGKLIVPELLQYGASVKNIVNTTEKLLYDAAYREQNIAQLGEVSALLSDKNSAYETAKIINQALQ
jgi:lipid-A-disaccharide synthase